MSAGYADIYRSPAGVDVVLGAYRQLLDEWPVPHERLRLPTREGDTFVLASGPVEAPPVLALHGSMSNASAWLPQIAALAPHLRVLAVDMIGEPGLSAPARPRLGSEAYARWLDDVLGGLGLSQVAMLGVSLGGWLAVDYATRRPGRVTRLALLTPAGIGRHKVEVLAQAILLRHFGDWGRRRTLRLAIGGTRFDGDEQAAALGEFALLAAEHFKPRMEPIPTFDDDTLGRLTMPVLAIAGGRDLMLDSRQTRARLEHAVPHATVTLLPEAGHLLPDQSAPVLRFLSGTG